MESLAADLNQMTRTPLHDSHVEALRANGEERAYAEGEYREALEKLSGR